jgi:hypothetical protein
MSHEPPVGLDMSGGADPSVDEVTAGVPASRSYREGASIWIWDDEGRWSFPRVGVEAVGATWSTSIDTALCHATPDGRLLLAYGQGAPLAVTSTAGRPRVLGTDEMRFECVDPFERWQIDVDVQAISTHARPYLLAGVPKPTPGPGYQEARVRLEVEATMVAPPWFQGTYSLKGHHVVGEHRFEQLAAVTGSVEVDGMATSFRGGALRVHRKGGDRNDYGEFHGHCWQSAVFPSGRAFGFLHYASGPDGIPRYREGWLIDGGPPMSAAVERTPWLRHARTSGEDVSFVLRTEGGEFAIEGTTHASSFRPPRPTAAGVTFPLLHSGIARYRWGDEEAYGIIERSARIDPRLAAD